MALQRSEQIETKLPALQLAEKIKSRRERGASAGWGRLG